MAFTQKQVDAIKIEVANKVLEALNGKGISTEIQADSAEIKAARDEKIKLQIMGLQAAASAYGSNAKVCQKIEELKIELGGNNTPVATRAGARYGENPYSYEQLLIKAEAELEGAKLINTRTANRNTFGLIDKIRFLKGAIASGARPNPRIRF